jgi:hypothetical protein
MSNIPISLRENRFLSETIKKDIFNNFSNYPIITHSKPNITIYNAKDPNSLKEAIRIYNYVSSFAPMNMNITSHLFLLDYPKAIDYTKDNITFNECNSGSTSFFTDYREICIWREEEWRKVFVHELIHAFEIDDLLKLNFSKENLIIREFPHYNGSIREAYTEILATIIIMNLSKTEYSLLDQCIFIGIQCNKIIKFIGLKHIFFFARKVSPKYILDKNTNTSSYYFLKSAYFWYALYGPGKSQGDLLTLNKLLDKEFINNNFYDILIHTFSDVEHLNWLERLNKKMNEFKKKDTPSLKMVIL